MINIVYNNGNKVNKPLTRVGKVLSTKIEITKNNDKELEA